MTFTCSYLCYAFNGGLFTENFEVVSLVSMNARTNTSSGCFSLTPRQDQSFSLVSLSPSLTSIYARVCEFVFVRACVYVVCVGFFFFSWDIWVHGVSREKPAPTVHC